MHRALIVLLFLCITMIMTPKMAIGAIPVEKEFYEEAANFELPTTDSEKIKLSDYKGKKVILNFWASWCPPCKQEIPDLEKFHQEHMKDVIILGVNHTSYETNGKDKIKAFVKEKGITFPILLDENGEISRLYQIISIPTTFFINTKGAIVKKYIGPLTFDQMTSMMSKMN